MVSVSCPCGLFADSALTILTIWRCTWLSEYGAQVNSSHSHLSGVPRMLLKCCVSRANHKVSSYTILISGNRSKNIKNIPHAQRWPRSWKYYHVFPVPLCLTGRSCVCFALFPSTSSNPHPQVHLHGHVLLLCQYRQQLRPQLQCTSPPAHDLQIGKFLMCDYIITLSAISYRALSWRIWLWVYWY